MKNNDFKKGIHYNPTGGGIIYKVPETPKFKPLKWYQRIDWAYIGIVAGIPLLVVGWFCLMYWVGGWDTVLSNLPFLVLGFLIASISR